MSSGAMFSHEETIELIGRAQTGDETAKDRLVEGNLALVKSVVKRYLCRGVEYDDLMQLGSMGLAKAIQRFDISLGLRFSTYAVPMIAGEIKRFLRDDGAVKVARSVKELAMRATAAAASIAERTGREAGVVEIALEVGESAEDVAMALDALRPTVSLNETLSDEKQGASIQDFVTDEVNEEQFVDRLLIKDMLSRLDMRERQIIVMRFFMDRTQAEIAEKLGVSQVQISRLIARILVKMREIADGGQE